MGRWKLVGSKVKGEAGVTALLRAVEVEAVVKKEGVGGVWMWKPLELLWWKVL